MCLTSDEKANITRKYDYARATFQRVNVDLANQNYMLATNLINACDSYLSATTSSLMSLTNNTYLTRYYNITMDLFDDYDLMTVDFDTIKNSFLEKTVVCMNPRPDLSGMITLMSDQIGGAFLEISTTGPFCISPTRLRLEACAETETSQYNEPSEVCYQTQQSSSDYYNCNDDVYGTFLYFKKGSMEKVQESAISVIATLQSMETEYNQTMMFVYGGTDVAYTSRSEYRKCLDFMRQTRSTWTSKLADLAWKYPAMYSNATCWSTKLKVTEEIESFYNASKNLSDSLTKDDIKPCYWFLKYDWFDTVYSLFLSHKDSAAGTYLEAMGIRHSLDGQAATMMSDIKTINKPIKQILEDYRHPNSNLTKTDLYRYFQSASMATNQAARRLAYDRYIADWQQFLTKLADIENNVKGLYENAFNLTIPTMNDTVLDNLTIVKYARQHRDSYPNLGKYLDQLKVDRKNSIMSIVSTLFDRYRQVMQDSQTRVIQSYQDLDNALAVLKADLSAYVSDGQLDNDFLKLVYSNNHL